MSATPASGSLRALRATLASIAIAHLVAWTLYALAISDAARYSFYREVWQFWFVFGLGAMALGVGASLLSSRRIATSYGLLSVVALLLLFGTFDAFYADVPAWAYVVIPTTTLLGAVLGLYAGRRFKAGQRAWPRSTAASDHSAESAP